MGATNKYLRVMRSLDDYTIYSPPSIVQHAENTDGVGYDPEDREAWRSAMFQIRKRNKEILSGFDGEAELEDGGTRQGYYAWRWRLAYPAWRKGEHPTCLFERAGFPTPEKYRLLTTAQERPDDFPLPLSVPIPKSTI